MWRLIWFLQGYVQAELRGASPEWALERLSNARVAFLRVQRIDDFTIALLILRKDVLKAEAAARKAMCELAVVREMGFVKTFGGLWRRRLFALGLVLCAAGAFVIPKFVFFYDVVGNVRSPTRKFCARCIRSAWASERMDQISSRRRLKTRCCCLSRSSNGSPCSRAVCARTLS